VGRKYSELLKLKGKITEKNETIKSVAKKAGMSRNTLGNKLDGKTSFTIAEIYKISDILDISSEEVVKYFFTDWSQNENQI